MMTLEERMSEPVYWSTSLQLELFREVKSHLELTGHDVESFASKAGVPPERIAEVMNGEFSNPLPELVQIALAMGKVPVITYRPLDEVIAEAKGKELSK